MGKTRRSNTTYYIDHLGTHRYVLTDNVCTDQELSDDEDSVAAEDPNEEHSDSDEDLLEVELKNSEEESKRHRAQTNNRLAAQIIGLLSKNHVLTQQKPSQRIR
jgi:hypothetical protein